MKFFIITLFVVVFVTPHYAIANKIPTLAVIGFSSDSNLTDYSRQTAKFYSQTFEKSGLFNLIEFNYADSTVASIGYSGYCRSAECLAMVGSYLKADYIVYGDFAIVDDIYVVNVRLFGVLEGEVVSRDYFVHTGEFENMLNEKIEPSFLNLTKGFENNFQVDSTTHFYSFLSDSLACEKEHKRGADSALSKHKSIGWSAGGFMAGALGNILGAVIVAAVATKVEVEPNKDSQNINFCYNTGYSEYAKRKNLNYALYGASAGIAVFFLFAYLNKQE